MEENSHHHGQVIKRYREKMGWTRPQLGEKWTPNEVSWKYIAKIESGEKHITDSSKLREISELLDIPLWEFGLSEYNPFNITDPSQSTHLYSENLEVVTYLVEQTWYLRKVAPMPEVEKSVKRLQDMFKFYQTHAPPPLKLEREYLRLFAQVHRLAAIIDVENQRYPLAIRHFENMLKIGQGIEDPTTIALAFMGLGTEYERMGKQQEAVDYLELARDQTFQTERSVACLVNSYLARAYASNHESQRFLRAIDTAQAIADSLGERFGSAKDFAYYTMSGVLAERSYGYLELGEAQKSLEMRGEITKSIHINENTWLHAWIPLDWARAYFMTGEIEESILETREFYLRAKLLQSPHTFSRAEAMLKAIEQAGYEDVSAVKDFSDEMEDE
ncbi:MAG: helix-turn-helix transcriptional regulator [Ktedonobacteraceae bacterium]|nr:helix-turn-helix transcriptional regulator [Ktedonobacteraceae bacterium]MBA3823725.1 helix-turn-helix transcriptional regulator [Ktedonobacterales bacterium]